MLLLLLICSTSSTAMVQPDLVTTVARYLYLSVFKKDRSHSSKVFVTRQFEFLNKIHHNLNSLVRGRHCEVSLAVDDFSAQFPAALLSAMQETETPVRLATAPAVQSYQQGTGCSLQVGTACYSCLLCLQVLVCVGLPGSCLPPSYSPSQDHLVVVMGEDAATAVFSSGEASRVTNLVVVS